MFSHSHTETAYTAATTPRPRAHSLQDLHTATTPDIQATNLELIFASETDLLHRLAKTKGWQLLDATH